ncbi:uncharacterized protein PHALS_05196 [Plasmopara halstedii]|uniref:Uncharacterized protein n=1 Tax=Plasmopara halstedii TaxID=4781 RepID=A0A0P1B1B1_PLAHL|nr:uncharacterized protein PHALS_05196 [Plasmopara halstedii]CEG47868.1 hypothetical protein PHALS_05196 [Plasmopara halstedii]|eukprot:XP_024584237.1 hypothetical protein PHALS_05196 [Plasmopara halstedii]
MMRKHCRDILGNQLRCLSSGDSEGAKLGLSESLQPFLAKNTSFFLFFSK